MLDLTPAKLLIVFVVAIVLLGPQRLPAVARQMGAGWRWLRGLQQRMDEELRKNVPDLPSSQELVRLARSPMTLLNELASMPTGDRDAPVVDPGAPAPPPVAGSVGVGGGERTVLPLSPTDDPGMN